MPNISQLLRRVTPNLYDPPLATRPWGDFNGAIAGAIAGIPLSLAYGLIIDSALGESSRGIGVLMALYGSVAVGIIATLVGGSPLLIAGPRAASLIVLAGLIRELSHSPALAQVPNQGHVILVLACSAIVAAGVLKLLFGAFRLGRIANYVPLRVVTGFNNGTALLIIVSEVWAATGVPAQKSLVDLFSHLDEIKPATILLTLATTAALRSLPREIWRLPTILLVFAAGTAIYHVLASFGFGAALGGTLPPPPDHFALDFIGTDAYSILAGPRGGEVIRPILVAAVSMAILSTLDTLLATSAADILTMRRSRANRQLMAEGLGNTLAGLFAMSPGSGSIIRTQAALLGGMASAATPIGVAVITLGITALLGPQIGFLPQAVTAGLLISFAIDLIDKWTRGHLRRLFSRRRLQAAADADLLLVGIVVATALIFNLATAVGMGMLLSLLAFVMQMAHSPIRRCYPATALIPGIFGDVARRNFIEQYGKHIAIIEVEGALFFGTASELETLVDRMADDGVIHLVIDLKRVKHIDATGALALERINSRLVGRGGILVVSHAGRDRRAHREHYLAKDSHIKPLAPSNWEMLVNLGSVAVIGEERFLRNTDQAVALCEKHLAANISDDDESKELLTLRSSLMQALDRNRLRRLRNYWQRVSFAAGDTIYAQGRDPNGAYLIAAGRVDVMLSMPGSEYKRKVQSLTAGAVFGELALIDDSPRPNGIVAAEATTCYWISSASFQRLKEEQPDIALAVLANVAMLFVERLRATDSMLAEMEH